MASTNSTPQQGSQSSQGSGSQQAATATTISKPALPRAAVASPFNSEWICSVDYIKNWTPSRLDNIPYSLEVTHRIRGTTFIRQTVSSLKLKPICKETAYIYFHRFFMLRSFRKFDTYRMALACVYLASKYEDHPAFKEHMVRIYNLFIARKDLKKTDKEYEESCDRLIRDENQLLQVLGFNSLGVRHFQVLIVESSSLSPIPGFSKAMYSSAYKIASEINRLSLLCVTYPSPILACVSIYLASLYHGTVLPDGWTNRVKGARTEILPLVIKVADNIKYTIARDSDIVQKLLSDTKVQGFPGPGSKPSPSPGQGPSPQQQQQQQSSSPMSKPANQQGNLSHSSNSTNSNHHHQQQSSQNQQGQQQQGTSQQNQNHQNLKRPHSSSNSHNNGSSQQASQLKMAGGGGGGGTIVPGVTTAAAGNVDFSRQILSTFSPDSAYSSNSSHSPPEKKRKKHYSGGGGTTSNGIISTGHKTAINGGGGVGGSIGNISNIYHNNNHSSSSSHHHHHQHNVYSHLSHHNLNC